MTPWPNEYACVDLSGLRAKGYQLRAIHWDDREPARQWRNEQIEILRQSRPLSAADQDAYYESVVRDQMSAESPAQVLVGFLLDGTLIGYGGIVHIAWHDRRGEVSFITATHRQQPDQFRADLGAFLFLIKQLAARLGMHRLTTETFEFRRAFVEELEQSEFVQEGRLREHVLLDGAYIDSIVHGVLLPPPSAPVVSST